MIFKKTSLFLLGLILLLARPAISSDIKVKMPSVLRNSNKQLVLNGQGVRHKMWLDLYVGGLYLNSKTTDAAKIINSNEHQAIRIEVISDVITSKRLRENMISEFDRVAGNSIGVYKSRIQGLINAFNEDVAIGDVFDLMYSPQEGMKIYKNNKLKSQVKGFDFKQLLFTIWLGSDPQDSGLKKGMLGL